MNQYYGSSNYFLLYDLSKISLLISSSVFPPESFLNGFCDGMAWRLVEIVELFPRMLSHAAGAGAVTTSPETLLYRKRTPATAVTPMVVMAHLVLKGSIFVHIPAAMTTDENKAPSNAVRIMTFRRKKIRQKSSQLKVMS